MAKYKLAELCEFITDGTHQTPEYCDDGVIFLSSKDVTERKINWDDVRYITEELHEKLYKRLSPRKNDILLAKNGTTGVAAIVDRDEIFDVYVSLAVLRPLETIYPKYLLYAINSSVAKSQFNAGLKGIGVPNLHLGVIRETIVNVIQRDEQEKVCEILDGVATLIEKRKTEIDMLDDLIKARFVEMFIGKDYSLITLDDLTLGKGEYGAQSAAIDYNSRRPRYVRITDINDDGTLNNDLVSSANVEDDEQYKLSYGDFMFARMGATVGKTYAYKSGNQIFAGYLIRYRLNLEKIMPEYLYVYTKLDEYRNWVLMNQSGAAQPGINAKKYCSLRIPVAPLEEQRVFADFVNQVDKSKVAVQEALKQTQTLFDSLMQKYFG